MSERSIYLPRRVNTLHSASLNTPAANRSGMKPKGSGNVSYCSACGQPMNDEHPYRIVQWHGKEMKVNTHTEMFE